MKEVIQYQVEQTIRDATTKQKESFIHRGQANKYTLNSYTKIDYFDHQEEPVTLKWMNDDLTQLQIRKKDQKYAFDLQGPRPLNYRTDQGVMSFQVHTKKLIISPTRIEVKYDLIFDEKSIGSYDFRLIYQT